MSKPNSADWMPFQSKAGMVRLVLSVMWDPIGVFGNKSTLDEYDGYVAAVLGLAEAGGSPEEISELLLQLERSNMGLSRPSSNEHRLLVSRKIIGALSNFRE